LGGQEGWGWLVVRLDFFGARSGLVVDDGLE
jgi:hypothetical protein